MSLSRQLNQKRRLSSSRSPRRVREANVDDIARAQELLDVLEDLLDNIRGSVENTRDQLHDEMTSSSRRPPNLKKVLKPLLSELNDVNTLRDDLRDTAR